VLGRRGIGLLDKARDGKHALRGGQRPVALDIAVAGFGALRMDAEGDEMAGARGGSSACDGRVKRGGIIDRVIGRHQQHQRLAVTLGKRQRGDAGGWRGVASDRLEQQPLRRDVDLAQLLGDDKAVLLIGDDERRGKARRGRDPQRGLLH
jgi:hypothetical protein